MKKPRKISELLDSQGNRIGALKKRASGRSATLEHVCRALPEELAAVVSSAGIEDARLTIGVASAAWAARLRYGTETLRMRVSGSTGIPIDSVRIKVVPPRALEP